MEEKEKISLGQLFLLLLLSRGFSLATRSAPEEGEGAVILTLLLSGAIQAAALTAGLFLCRRRTGVSPFLVPGSGFSRLQFLLYWAFCLLAAVCTVVDFVSFMTAVVYDYREGWLVAVTFTVAGALAASQGLEGLARGGGILAALLGVGCCLIAAGLWKEYDWRNLTTVTMSWGDNLARAFSDAAMNWELFALLLLLPSLRKGPGAASCAGWVGVLTLLSAAVRLMTVLTLGSYGGMKPFPVFTAVTSVGFRSFQRLDSVFLAIWVTLGLARLAVFLTLASRCSAGAFFRPWGTGWVWGNAALAAAAALTLWSGPEGWGSELYRRPAGWAAALLGVLLLPLAGWMLDRKEEKR